MSMYDNIDKDAVGRLLQQALSGHKTSTEFVHNQGKILLKTGFCIRDMENNMITGAAIIAHDITELNRLRDEIGRMERLSLVGKWLQASLMRLEILWLSYAGLSS